MKIDLTRFPENESVLLKEDIVPQDLDLDIGVMRFPEKIKLQAEGWKTEEDLSLEVHIEGERHFTCSRCLEDFNNLFEKDFTLHYDIKGLDSVNIDQDVRDEIILDHPIQVVCQTNCRGLCPDCGTNLNTERCRCKGKA